jgi:hypothetical protein
MNYVQNYVGEFTNDLEVFGSAQVTGYTERPSGEAGYIRGRNSCC